MSDRELLDLAAKAGGVKPHEIYEDYLWAISPSGMEYGYGQIIMWSPLTNLSDATSLFLSLSLIDSARFRRWYDDLRGEGMDNEEAYCRAVTYTAAEIGEGMGRESA